MKRGQVVTIYDDPITQEKIEGKAKLLQQEREDVGDGLEMWRVKFLDDGWTGTRTILVRPQYGE